MPPKFEAKFGIPGSHEPDSQLTSALYRLYRKVEKNEDGTEHLVEITPQEVEAEVKRRQALLKK